MEKESEFQVVQTPRGTPQRRSHMESSWQEVMMPKMTELADKNVQYQQIQQCQQQIEQMDEMLKKMIVEKEQLTRQMTSMIEEYEKP